MSMCRWCSTQGKSRSGLTSLCSGACAPGSTPPMRVPLTRDVRTPLLLLVGGVGAVLLMACTNLANLLLIRSTDRRKDIQLRTALGATTRQILRQTLTESCLLAAVGSATGVAVAIGLTRILHTSAWLDVPRLADARI